jgi:hypothetical protein
VHNTLSVMGEDDRDEQHMEANRRGTVETVKKPSDTSASVCLARNARHDGEGVFRGRTLYFSTVDLVTSMPSFRSSLWMRGDPQEGLAREILRRRSRISGAMRGRPGVPGRLSRVRWSRNRLRRQEITVLGFTETGTSCQPDHALDSHAQSNRSAVLSRVRRPPQWRTASWRRSARTSRCRDARGQSRATMELV